MMPSGCSSVIIDNRKGSTHIHSTISCFVIEVLEIFMITHKHDRKGIQEISSSSVKTLKSIDIVNRFSFPININH